jgi:hypothetical protein
VVVPKFKLQGLADEATYEVEGLGKAVVEVSGSTLMRGGLALGFSGDYQSTVLWVTRK